MSRLLSRRTMLRGAGAAVALPFLGSMLRPLQSHAGPDIPKRLVIFFTPNGTIPDAWRPSGGERDFRLSEILSPLERHRPKLNILEGIDMVSAIRNPGGSNGHDVGTGHALTPFPLQQGPSGVGEFGHLWDGSAGGTSFDQHVSNTLDAESTFKSLVFGVRCDIRQAIPSRISWRRPFEPIRPMQEPGIAYDRIFGAGVQESASIARYRAQKLKVVDSVLEDYHRLYGQLGSEDRQRMQSHLTSLREVEKAIEGLDQRGDCTAPERQESSYFPTVGALSMDMMVSALACDLTRVGVLQWTSGQGGPSHQWLGVQRHHHSLSHESPSNSEARQELIDINNWYANQFAELLDRMERVDVGDGSSLLDHSLVLWCNELGEGYTHTKRDIPYVLAGSANGAIDTGRYLRFDGNAHGELFTAMANALDLPDTHFGVREYCDGPLPGLLA